MVVGRGGEGRKQGGITLLELLIAVSLSGLVILTAYSLLREIGAAARLTGRKRDAVSAAEAAFGSLAGNLMYGKGIVRIAPGAIRVLNRAGKAITYAWEDSALAANGIPFDFRLDSLGFEAFGPRRPGYRAFYGEAPWELDSLDGDRDGRIDFDELDRDRDGALDAEETRFLAGLRVTLAARQDGVPLAFSVLVHPRNRFADTASADGDVGNLFGGFTRP